ncbi:hypothetical protein niasHT_009420 [Heterodera trifolii]|uniref:Tr-type G domain-containing protein n=1 Tax=Heterodera trifolii TaxID=157864 RepID=A0ABD2MEL0_9BILA
MSRHRNVRQLKLEDELDEEEDVDYDEEEEPPSPESSQFIYQRDTYPSNDNRLPVQPHKTDEGEKSVQQRGDEGGQYKQQKPKTTKPQKEKPSPVSPSVENLRLSEVSKARTNSKSPCRVGSSSKSTPTNLEMAMNAPLGQKKPRVRPSDIARPLNLVVVGHVDAGKSTMVGHLLYQLGGVEERIMHKHRQESSRKGKSSFAFAWILDESEEERNRGVTMDIARTTFASPSGRTFGLLDAPGHKDFIPNMISGASQADAALLVVNATRGEFETGFDQGGQTREHALLVRALGISRLVVAVNKMDTVDWSKERYDHLSAILSAFLLRRAGFESVIFVPVSGLLGINLTSKPEDGHPLSTWHLQRQSLVEALDALQLPNQSVADQQPLRVIVSDVLRCAPQSLVLNAKVSSGHIEVGEKLWLMPEATPVTVKAISIDGASSEEGTPTKKPTNEKVFFAGDQITLSLVGLFESDSVFPGHVLCRGGKELLIPSQHFSAKIVTFDIRMPILKGTQAELFLHSLRVPCVVSRLCAINPGAKETEKRNPRLLLRNIPALIELRTELPVNVEPFARNKTFGRLALRSQGETIAAGVVEQCF